MSEPRSSKACGLTTGMSMSSYLRRTRRPSLVDRDGRGAITCGGLGQGLVEGLEDT